jgi:hypothetical protein
LPYHGELNTDKAMKFFAISTFAAILLVAFDATAKMTNDFVEAVIQGRQLAQQLCEAQPVENFANTGVLHIRNAKGQTTNVSVKFETTITQTNWSNIFDTSNGGNKSGKVFKLIVNHEGISNQYFVSFPLVSADVSWGRLNCSTQIMTIPRREDGEIMIPFAGSDFWIADLGLEFFHWPEQKILKHEMRRGRPCKVLESINPNPSANGYSRVVSWIDNETLGIVQAEAYDANGKLLKEFYPKTFKKVNGQWELQEMEIRNDQTGSRTRLEFNLKQPD